MTLPEILLWQELRKRPDNLKYRHQHPAGVYIVDFYCPEVDLVIEVDGEIHGRGDNPRRDEIRNAWLAAQGVRVLHINASDVLGDLDAVVRLIRHTARGV